MRKGEEVHFVTGSEIPHSNDLPCDWLESLGIDVQAIPLVHAFGFSDAKLLRTPIRFLSAGEKARLSLLATIAKCQVGDTLLIDE